MNKYLIFFAYKLCLQTNFNVKLFDQLHILNIIFTEWLIMSSMLKNASIFDWRGQFFSVLGVFFKFGLKKKFSEHQEF